MLYLELLIFSFYWSMGANTYCLRGFRSRFLLIIVLLAVSSFIGCKPPKKIDRLKACMKLSRCRQDKDSKILKNLIHFLSPEGNINQKANDLLALMMVVCYKHISGDEINAVISVYLDYE